MRGGSAKICGGNLDCFVALLLAMTAIFLSAKAVAGDAFVTSSIAEPSNLIPYLASDTASAEISRLIFNGLVKYDENLKLTGDLAENWEIKNGGLGIIFHLRKNVRWQDGELFTAKDVEFTFRQLTDPNTPTPYGADFEKVKSLKVLDDFTVEVEYSEPFSPGLASWGMGIVPAHAPGKPVGTGPYLLKKWKSGQSIELWANPGYFEGRPNIDRYVYRIIPDQASEFLELQTENLDSAVLSPLQFKRQTDSDFFKAKYAKYRLPSFGYAYIGYNLKNPLFADARVRKAIGLAVNKQEIIDAVLLGYGKVCTGPFLPDSWAYNPEVKESEFLPQKAKTLLNEAGWRDSDGDGIVDQNGKKFSFTILTNQGNDQRRAACEIIQRRLKEAGIEMKIQIVEWSVFLKEFIDRKRFEAVLLAWQLGRDPDIYNIFHSSKTKSGEFNFVSYQNQEVDRLLEAGRRVFDESERAKIYRRVHEILSEEQPYTFLYVPDSLMMMHRRFRGVRVAPAGIGFNFIHWFVPKDEERYRWKLSLRGALAPKQSEFSMYE